jgi:hypothetical protein
VCRQCGARNPDDFECCGSCGAPLRDSDSSQPTIIDISDDHAEIVTGDEDRTRTFGGYTGQARVYVTRGGSRSCLIFVVVALLAACCVCVGWWTVAENLFF